MLVLQEDRATSWDAMQAVMRQPDFMDRVMELDCTATPLPKQRRKKILTELGICRRSSITQQPQQQATGRLSLGRPSTPMPRGTQLENAMRNWLNTQVLCSEAREAEEQVVDDCFAEHQEQALLVREVNSTREKMAEVREKVMEKKLAICGDTPLAALLLEDGAASVDSFFYRRTDKGRPVTEIILRESVLVNFGAKAEEVEDDDNVYVRLTPEEVAQLQHAVRVANEVHDVDELEALTAAEAREEQEIRELKQRMEELRQKEDFTEEDEEEMRQLDALLTEVVHRHETTQWRIRQLQAVGRDKLFLAQRRANDLIESELRLRFSGDAWPELLESNEHRANLQGALCRDLNRALGLPEKNFSNFRFALGSLLVDFTVKHSRDVTAEQLQALADEADFAEFCGYYEKVTFKQTVPLNTVAQRAAYEAAQRAAEELRLEQLRAMNFGGAGLPEKLEDFADDEEGASDDEDYRKSHVTIAEMRNEYARAARIGYPLLAHIAFPYEAMLVEQEQEQEELRRQQQEELEKQQGQQEEELEFVEIAEPHSEEQDDDPIAFEVELEAADDADDAQELDDTHELSDNAGEAQNDEEAQPENADEAKAQGGDTHEL
ncbi:hypothetical protein DQ04_06731030 [Trypanosoma grayi]|uniref:hypothetical protein n=1 Tax=Trypanosoma grayi TaxID=71804 RepID=UPI0004F4782A|nr:hypothetical protein DQ04_06731030 [Trypanosoma grayi]KEG08646.1 hypothetical protein DQ04_06731030 [Trypanosoma grayi]